MRPTQNKSKIKGKIEEKTDPSRLIGREGDKSRLGFLHYTWRQNFRRHNWQVTIKKKDGDDHIENAQLQSWYWWSPRILLSVETQEDSFTFSLRRFSTSLSKDVFQLQEFQSFMIMLITQYVWKFIFSLCKSNQFWDTAPYACYCDPASVRPYFEWKFWDE